MAAVSRPDAIGLVHERAAVLAALTTTPRTVSGIANETPHSRATVDRALSELADAGLAADADDGYVATVGGRLAKDRHGSLLGAGWTDEDLTLVDSRRSLLATLATDRRHKPDLVETLDASRSTVDRAVGALEDAGLVDRGGGGFGATRAGVHALARYRRYLDDQRAILDAAPALAPLPPDVEIPPSAVTGGEPAAADARFRLFEQLVGAFAAAESCRVAVPELADSRHLRLAHRAAVEDDVGVTVLAPGAVHERLVGEFPHLIGELGAADGVTALRGSVPEYGLVVADCGPEHDRALLVTYDDGVAGVLSTSDPAAVAWAREQFGAAVDAATATTGAWTAATAAADIAPMTGERLPAQLRTEGFVRVDEEYLDGREPLDPAAAWRTGVSLAAVDDGVAVPRYPADAADADGQTGRESPPGEPPSLADRIETELRDGADVAVLGPTGSGKSTVCKRVAVAWARAGTGSVLYRESGAGQPFSSPGALTAYLERAGGPVLVVVEDAARPETAPVAEVLRQVGGREDVAFLLDARESEWTGDGRVAAGAGTAAYRRSAVETVRVPPVDEATCEVAVDHAGSLLPDFPSVEAADLAATVREADGDGVAPDGAAILFGRLARLADPLADYQPGGARSTLDDHVETVHADLGDLPRGGLAVGVATALLTVAGVGVSPVHLYAQVTRDGVTHETVTAAVDRLRGDVLFERDERGPYRTIQRSWAARFLDHVGRDGSGPALVGEALSPIFALADDADAREAVAGCLGGDAPTFESILTDPTAWADGLVERIFEAGRRYPKLATLFGTSDGSAIELPAACSPDLPPKTTAWRGEMSLAAGDLERADREFAALVAAAADLPAERAEWARFTGQFGRSRVARKQGRLDDAAADAAVALSVAESRERAVDVGRARLELGRIAHARGDLDDAEAECEAAVEAFADRDHPAHAAAWDELAELATKAGDYGLSRDRFERSAAIYEAIGDPRSQARVCYNLGDAAFEQSDMETAANQLRRGLELAREVGAPSLECSILKTLGSVVFFRDTLEAAAEYYEQGLSIADAIGDRRTAASIRTNLATVAVNDDDEETALEHLTAALSTARDLDATGLEAKCLRDMTQVEMTRGNLEVATDYARDALALAVEASDRQVELQSRYFLGIVRMRADDLATAREQFETIRRSAREMDDGNMAALATSYLARTALRAGNLVPARAHARALERRRARGEEGAAVADDPRTTLGWIELCAGDPDRASEWFEAASAGGAADPRLLVGLARTKRRRGDLEGARDHVDEARSAGTGERTVARVEGERGAIELAAGDLRASADALDAAVEAAEWTDHYLAAAARFRRAQARRRLGDRESARADLETVLDRHRTVGDDRRRRRTLAALVDVCYELGEPSVARDYAVEERSVTERRPESADGG